MEEKVLSIGETLLLNGLTEISIYERGSKIANRYYKGVINLHFLFLFFLNLFLIDR